MQYFGQYRGETIHSLMHLPRDGADALVNNPGIAALENSRDSRLLSFATDPGVSLSENDLKDQFIQFSKEEQGPTILDTSEVEPLKQGGDDKPEALAVLQLASFNVGTDEGIDKKTRATLRLDLGKDANSSSSLDTVFWSIAAGMNLYNEAKAGRSDAKDLKTDFNDAFSRRPVEIPGGLGNLSFEVVKHTGGCDDGPAGDLNFTSTFSGTSATAPQASGVAALILALETGLTEAAVRGRMRSTADDDTGLHGGADDADCIVYHGETKGLCCITSVIMYMYRGYVT